MKILVVLDETTIMCSALCIPNSYLAFRSWLVGNNVTSAEYLTDTKAINQYSFSVCKEILEMFYKYWGKF